MAAKDTVFFNTRRVCSDDCAKEAKDTQNDGIFGYNVYQYLPAGACKDPNARFPTFAYDHVNLRGRVGYGVSDDCLVDNYSELRTDPRVLTRDRCPIQLFSRIFQGCPRLKPGVSDPDLEYPVKVGTSTTELEGVYFPCKKQLEEQDLSHRYPLLDCVKTVQDPEHVVEPWTRGGIDTRNYVNRKEFLESCGMRTSFKQYAAAV